MIEKKLIVSINENKKSTCDVKKSYSKITETNTAIQEVYDAQTALNDKMKELEEQCSALQKIANKWVVHA